MACWFANVGVLCCSCLSGPTVPHDLTVPPAATPLTEPRVRIARTPLRHPASARFTPICAATRFGWASRRPRASPSTGARSTTPSSGRKPRKTARSTPAATTTGRPTKPRTPSARNPINRRERNKNSRRRPPPTLFPYQVVHREPSPPGGFLFALLGTSTAPQRGTIPAPPGGTSWGSHRPTSRSKPLSSLFLHGDQDKLCLLQGQSR